ncbi:hypothetical protein KBY25_09350 [Ruegeria pomeroyi]|nr:hypothetical protein [Ruegeria pomeroyi]
MAAAPQAFDDDGLAPLVHIHAAGDPACKGTSDGATKRIAAVSLSEDRTGTSTKHSRSKAFLIELVLVAGKGLTGR